MSFRFHKGPSLVTLFHDPSSSTSQKILHLLSSHPPRRTTVRDGQLPHRPFPSTHGGETDVVQSQLDSSLSPAPPVDDTPPFQPSASSSHPSEPAGRADPSDRGGTASAYLREAASAPTESLFHVEVLDRHESPPTPDQVSSILGYLDAQPDLPSASDSVQSRLAGRTPTASEEQTRRRQILQSRNEGVDGLLQHGVARIKEGPLVVHWDEGFATTTVEGVQAMLKRLEAQQRSDAEAKRRNDPGGCAVM